MKKLGILLFVVIAIVIVFLVFGPKSSDVIIVKPADIKMTVDPTATIIPTPTSGYSAEVKSNVRSDFISSCTSKGHYSTTECNCSADYLSKNYSEAELAKIYVQYHSTNKVPSQLEAAAKACVKK